MPENTTQATLALIKGAQMNPDPELAKAWQQSNSAITGITAYDLEAPAKQLYPVLTPLRNEIPRLTGGMGIQANWRAVTGVNTGNLSLGLGQGNRGGVQSVSTASYSANFRGLGLDDNLTFEADLAAVGFQDLKALAVESLLRATMIGEEKLMLGGNSSLQLGVTPTPTLVAAATGGSLGASLTESVICVALTPDGFASSSIGNGVPGLVSRTNADGSVDTYGGGSAQKSANATVTTGTGTTNSISASVAPVIGAAAYAWFWGAAGSEVLGAITTINSVVITAAATGTQTAASLPAADNSTNDLIFDGFLTLAQKSISNAYLVQQATGTPGTGTPLTSNGNGGIVEIDAALKWYWDEYKLSPSVIWVSSQEQRNITAKILSSASNAAQRFMADASNQGGLIGGFVVRSYLNPYSMNGTVEIPIRIHPNLPAGTIFFFTKELPYPLSNVGAINQMKLRRDYYQIEWPMTSRRYEYGVYFDGVLQSYAPFSLGVISNIANG